MNSRILKIILSLIIILVVITTADFVSAAFVNPSGKNSPPNGGAVPTIINTSTIGQTKGSGIIISSNPSNLLGLLIPKGKIGVGVRDPIKDMTTLFTVNGSVKIADGSQGQGRVLVSDSNGTGTWTPRGITGSAKQVVVAFNGSSCPREEGWIDFTDAAGRVVVGTGLAGVNSDGSSPNATTIALLEKKGTEKEIIDDNEIPIHTHTIIENGEADESGEADDEGDNGSVAGSGKTKATCSPDGSVCYTNDQRVPHNNMQPYVVTSYCVKSL